MFSSLVLILSLLQTQPVAPTVYRARMSTTIPQPALNIVIPTTDDIYNTSSASMHLAGTSALASSITWVCDNVDPPVAPYSCGSGTATGTDSWDAGNLTLTAGANYIVVTNNKQGGGTITDKLTANYTAGDVVAPTVTLADPPGATTCAPNKCVTVTSTPIHIGGTCTDNVDCVTIWWECAGCAQPSGTVTWAKPNWDAYVPLSSGSGNTITVHAQDAVPNESQADHALVVTYTPGLSIYTTSIPSAIRNQSYTSGNITATGGTLPYTWSEVGSNLGFGNCVGSPNLALTQNNNIATVSGTPTTGGDVSCNFTLRVTDAAKATAEKAFSIYISASGQDTNSYFSYNINPSNRPEIGWGSPAPTGSCGTRGTISSWTLRTQDHIGCQTKVNGATISTPNVDFLYDYVGDTFPGKKDAAKLEHEPKPYAVVINGTIVGDGSHIDITIEPIVSPRKKWSVSGEFKGFTLNKTGIAAMDAANWIVDSVNESNGCASEPGLWCYRAHRVGTVPVNIGSGEIYVSSDAIDDQLQFQFGIDTSLPNSDKYVFVYDIYFTDTFLPFHEINKVGNYKWTQWGGSETDQWIPFQYWLTQTDFLYAKNCSLGDTTKCAWNPMNDPAAVAAIDYRIMIGDQHVPCCQITNASSYEPTGQGAVGRDMYAVRSNRWTRFIKEVKLNIPATSFTEWAQQTNNGNPIDTYNIVSSTHGATTEFKINYTGASCNVNTTLGSYTAGPCKPDTMFFTGNRLRVENHNGLTADYVITMKEWSASIAATNPATVTTASAHGLSTGDKVIFSTLPKGNTCSDALGFSNSPTFLSITVTGANTFTLDGISCSVASTTNGILTDPNRFTVPTDIGFDGGASGRAIRILSMFSEYICDETRDCIPTLRKVPWFTKKYINSIWFEYSTSSKPGPDYGQSGTIILYFKNLFVLKNYNIDDSCLPYLNGAGCPYPSSILVKPVPGG